MSIKLKELSQLCQSRLDNILETYLISPDYPAKVLQQAMAYSATNGGKRIRPLLVYAIGHLFKAPLESLDMAACAIELIHTYSLIHDDLPAMDNSDLRRSNPTCHKAFSEAIALLAGDTLQSLAFEILATHPAPLSSEQRLAMIAALSKAAGMHGMAGGQAIDLEGTHSLKSLNQMHQLKTGALFTACVKLGAIASNLQDPSTLHELEAYIEQIGLAFQIQDDLLDVQGDKNLLGKPTGLDHANHKLTYLSLFNAEKTQEIINTLFNTALEAIQPLGEKAELLRELAQYMLQRKK